MSHKKIELYPQTLETMFIFKTLWSELNIDYYINSYMTMFIICNDFFLLSLFSYTFLPSASWTLCPKWSIYILTDLSYPRGKCKEKARKFFTFLSLGLFWFTLKLSHYWIVSIVSYHKKSDFTVWSVLIRFWKKVNGTMGGTPQISLGFAQCKLYVLNKWLLLQKLVRECIGEVKRQESLEGIKFCNPLFFKRCTVILTQRQGFQKQFSCKICM
jgi:hypothetical protein